MTNRVYYTEVATPIGPLLLSGEGGALTSVWLPSGRSRRQPDAAWLPDAAPFREAARQLRAYFAGELRTFSLVLEPKGTAFQRRVWEALLEIPYGETASYRDIASKVGRPAAVRAVGAANGCNPIPIIIPCHRVVGSDGSLTGYGGGLETKRFLLDLEQDSAFKAPLLPR